MITVLLVHGVNADVSWQDRIAFVLYPHFDTVKITYPQFQSPSTASLLGNETVLLVEDEEQVRLVAASILERNLPFT